METVSRNDRLTFPDHLTESSAGHHPRMVSGLFCIFPKKQKNASQSADVLFCIDHESALSIRVSSSSTLRKLSTCIFSCQTTDPCQLAFCRNRTRR